MELEIKRFENADEVRTFDKGTFEVVRIGGMTIGRAKYEPGWQWSEHVGTISGTASCEVSTSAWSCPAARCARWTKAGRS